MTIPTPAAYWKLDEASGSATDSIGSETLTDNNTVTSAAGKQGTARQFTAANSESLSHADDATLSVPSGSLTFAAWVYANSYGGVSKVIISKDDGGGNREYDLYYHGAQNKFSFIVWDSGGTPYEVFASTLGAPSTATWYFVVAWYDVALQTLNLQVNNGGVDTTTSVPSTRDQAAPFALGAMSSGALFWDGRIDEVGLWKQVLTSGDRTDLYNSGAGVTYPFPVASKTWYITDTWTEQWNQRLLLPDGPAPSTDYTGMLWTVGTLTPTKYARAATTPTFGTTPEPSSEPNGNFDSLRTGRLRGSVLAGTWTLSVPVIAFNAGGAQDGRMRCRVWQSSHPQGRNATELTSGAQVGTTVTNLTSGTAQTSTITMTLPALTLHNEFLFVQLAWEITGAGSSAGADVIMLTGATAKLETPAFTTTELPVFAAAFVQTTAGPDIWTDLTDRFMGYHSVRGRQDNLSGITAGTLQVDLDDDDSALDPENPSSAYYPNLKLQRKLRVTSSYAGFRYGRGQGFINSYGAEPIALGANVALSAEDIYTRLLRQKVSTDRPAETDADRITALLALAGIIAPQTSDGTFVPPAVSLIKASMLEHIDLLIKAGRGTFVIDPGGTPVYHDRHWRIGQASIGTFGAQGTYAIPTPQPVLDDAGLFNQITVERDSSTNEVQRITITGNPSAGALWLSFRGQTTAAVLGWNSTAGAVQTALQALSTIGSGNVSCSGGPFPNTPIDVTFTGTLAGQDVPELTAVQTFGGAYGIAVTTVTPGLDHAWTVDDTASQADYGVITFVLEAAAVALLRNDEDAQQWADWFLYQHATPTSRFRRIQIDPWVDPALWPLVFAATIGTKLTIHHSLPGTTGINEDYYIEGIEESLITTGDPELSVSWNISRVEAASFWKLDSAVELEVDTRLAY